MQQRHGDLEPARRHVRADLHHRQGVGELQLPGTHRAPPTDATRSASRSPPSPRSGRCRAPRAFDNRAEQLLLAAEIAVQRGRVVSSACASRRIVSSSAALLQQLERLVDDALVRQQRATAGGTGFAGITVSGSMNAGLRQAGASRSRRRRSDSPCFPCLTSRQAYFSLPAFTKHCS